ncbi:hypothetical protein [Phytohabitans aurantiacus]|uniref:ABC transporter permease n=1 Tax=Phytohabitans aurantiacus TaxID=3016789 RepID=A0ABQ5QZG5_9ACTN|nr:hypothetical protein [Phytohabitans aurantiacus]GLH98730.1 hypothetical protein Pa4123_40050 [Phytohabitans aurantiacus]
MRPLPLWRHEARRAGWTALLTPPLAVAAPILIAFVDAGANASDHEIAQNLFGALEMGVPLAAGIGAASLVGRDPAAELLLTTPAGYRTILLRRLAVTVGWTALVALLLAVPMIATGWWAKWPANHGALPGQLIWLAPTLGLAALGFLAGAAFRGPAAAGGLVAIFWIFQQMFADRVQEQGWSRQLYLFATTRGAVPADWTANRITLIAVSIVLGALAWLLLGRTERLIQGVTE